MIQYCKNVSSLQINTYFYALSTKIQAVVFWFFFNQKFTFNSPIHMEMQKGKNSKSILEEKQIWKT